MARKLPMLTDPQAKKIISSLCKEHELDLSLVTAMLEIQRENLGRGRQVGISQEFSATIQEFLERNEEK